MELWNKRNITMPPNNSVKMKKEDLDLIQLKSIFNNALKVMEEKHVLHREAALLSRYIYKVQRGLRGSKGLMYMYKVNRGLKRYISLDLQYVYSNFSKIFSCVDDIDEYVYVPTKQMLQYVLVRTQGFCKVMNYLFVACQDAALYFREILHLGHLVNLCVVSLGMVSRIWLCTRYFMICAAQWYDQLLPYLEKLKMKGPCWLPREYEFTVNLGSWLGSDPITGELKYDVDVQKISKEISQIKSFEDVGTLVNREDFMVRRNEKAGILQGESIKMGSLKTNSKLLTIGLKAEMTANSMNFFPRNRKRALENGAGDLNKRIGKDHLLIQEVESECMTNTMLLQDDLGELISRDQFHAQMAKNKSVLGIRDEFRETPNNFQSKKLKLPLQTSTSLEDTKSIPGKSNRENQILLLGSARNDISEKHKFVNNIISERKNNVVLEKAVHTPLKLNKLKSSVTKTSTNTTASCKDAANKGRQVGAADKSLSSEALADVLCSSTAQENVSISKHQSDSKTFNVDSKEKSIDAPLSYTQLENEFVQNIQSLGTLNDNEDIPCVFELKLNTEQISNVSECQQQCTINSGFKKKKNVIGNWEIINGIRTLKDVKTFLHSEKMARRKGKKCVTSQLNNSEWTVLFQYLNKYLKKQNVLKVKGNTKLNTIMEEIRNTLISFVI